jgi:hypothetical protein
VNSSTYEFVKKTVKHFSRVRLLRTKAKLHCEVHGLQLIQDAYPNKTVLLACGCRRQSNLRTDSEVAAFETATQERQRRRLVNAGKNSASPWLKIYEEDIEGGA